MLRYLESLMKRRTLTLNTLALLAAAAFSSCAGVATLERVKFSEKRTPVDLRLRKRYINWYVDFRSPEPTVYVEGWATNTGTEPIASSFQSYDDKRRARILDPDTDRTPDKLEEIIIRPGERKRFFRGPLFLLGMSLPDRDRRTANVEVEVILDELPPQPCRGELLGSFGGP